MINLKRTSELILRKLFSLWISLCTHTVFGRDILPDIDLHKNALFRFKMSPISIDNNMEKRLPFVFL